MNMPARLLVLLVLSLAMGMAAADTSAPPLRRSTWTVLDGAYKALEAGRTDSALEALDGLDAALADHPYERAVVAQLLGHVHLRRGDRTAAMSAFGAALDAGVLPITVTADVTQALAQLYLEQAQHGAAIEVLRSLPEEARNAAHHALLGYALLQAGRSQEALGALALAIDAKQPVPLGWLELRLAAELETNDLAAAAGTVEALLARVPDNAAHWRRLAALRQQQGDHAAAAAVLACARRLGLLEADEQIDLAQLLLATGTPRLGARLLDALAPHDAAYAASRSRAWLLAREPDAATAVLKAALDGDDDSGALAEQLGLLRYRARDWRGAWDAFERMLASPHEPDAESVLAAAISAIRDGAPDAGRRLLERARVNAATRERAERWLTTRAPPAQ